LQNFATGKKTLRLLGEMCACYGRTTQVGRTAVVNKQRA